jgi:hypothetical protein
MLSRWKAVRTAIRAILVVRFARQEISACGPENRGVEAFLYAIVALPEPSFYTALSWQPEKA